MKKGFSRLLARLRNKATRISYKTSTKIINAFVDYLNSVYRISHESFVKDNKSYNQRKINIICIAVKINASSKLKTKSSNVYSSFIVKDCTFMSLCHLYNLMLQN